MKIAFIGKLKQDDWGIDALNYISEISSRLPKNGHEIFFYASPRAKFEQCEQDKLADLKMYVERYSNGFAETFGATFTALFSDFEIVNYVGHTSLFWAFLLRLFKWEVKVVSILPASSVRKKTMGQKILERVGFFLAAKLAHKIIVDDKSLAKKIRTLHEEARVEVLASGIDMDKCFGAERIAAYDLKPKKYILAMGDIQHSSGFHRLITEFKKLENTSKISNNFKLVIAEDGITDDGYLSELEMLSEGRKTILFLLNADKQTKEELISNAYCLIQILDNQKGRELLLEAMAQGTAVFVSDRAKNRKVVQRSGILFSEKISTDLGAKLAYYINKETEVEKFGRSARSRIKHDFSWDRIANKAINIYCKLLNAKKGDCKKCVKYVRNAVRQ